MSTPAAERVRGQRLPRLRRLVRPALSSVTLAGLTIIATVTVGTSVVTAGKAGAATCGAPQPVKVGYTVGSTASAPSPGAIKISSVHVSGLASGCDGQSAKLVLAGNPTGNSKTPTTFSTTVTSRLDPCPPHSTLSNPTTVQTGSFTFHLCPGNYVSVHDLTELSLFIAGVQIGVTPVTGATSNSGSGNGGSGGNNGSHSVTSATSSSSSLAFTGADIAFMTGGGVLVVLLGLFLLLISRRHRSATGGDGQ